MSDDKMREAFEEENPVPEALIYQDFTDTYEFEHEEHTLTFKQKSGYNEAYTHFEEGWDAALTHHQAESEPVGWMVETNIGRMSFITKQSLDEFLAEAKDKNLRVVPLYTRSQPAAQVEEWRHDSESLEALHMNLDKAGVPREEDGVVLSEWGRVCRYKPAVQVPDGWRETIEEAHNFISERAFVGQASDLCERLMLLTTAPSIAEKPCTQVPPPVDPNVTGEKFAEGWNSCRDTMCTTGPTAAQSGPVRFEDRKPVKSDFDYKGHVQAWDGRKWDLWDRQGVFEYAEWGLSHWMPTGLRRPQPLEVQ